MKGFIIYPTYRIINGKACVLLYGRLENGHSFLTINEFKPYFFIESSKLKTALKIEKFEYEETKLKNFQGELMIKIILDSPKELSELRNELKESKITTYESDIRYPIRFLMDHDIQGAIDIEGDYDMHDTLDRVYKNPEVKKTDYSPKNLKVFSFDIESDKKAKQIYCISAYSKDYKKSIIVSNKKIPGVISCKTEEELLERFHDELLAFDPDIITGWNVIDFDLDFLKRKFKKYNIPFNLGRDNAISKLRIESNFFRTSKAEIAGRVVLDGIDLTKSSFIKLENYKLDTAAQELLGKKKLIQSTGKEKSEEIDHLYKNNQKKLIEYNLLDAELAYDVVMKADLIDLAIQRSLLTGMPLDRVNSSIASLDMLYIPKARKKGIVSPSKFDADREARIKGGYVMESKPGIYDNVIVLDFKSLYPQS
jgi:DNA polymerase II